MQKISLSHYCSTSQKIQKSYYVTHHFQTHAQKILAVRNLGRLNHQHPARESA
jgi:hypothetical protein